MGKGKKGGKGKGGKAVLPGSGEDPKDVEGGKGESGEGEGTMELHINDTKVEVEVTLPSATRSEVDIIKVSTSWRQIPLRYVATNVHIQRSSFRPRGRRRWSGRQWRPSPWPSCGSPLAGRLP